MDYKYIADEDKSDWQIRKPSLIQQALAYLPDYRPNIPVIAAVSSILIGAVGLICSFVYTNTEYAVPITPVALSYPTLTPTLVALLNPSPIITLPAETTELASAVTAAVATLSQLATPQWKTVTIRHRDRAASALA